MAALFAKHAPGTAPALQQGNPGAGVGPANSKSLPMPSYSPPRGQIYGVDPMLMRIAMQKQMFEQRQKQRAVAEALRKGWEVAKRWHDERRGAAPPAAYGAAPTGAGQVSVNGPSSYGGQQAQSGEPQSQGWISATGPNGHKIVVHNGRWVDAQTGVPIR